MENNNCFETYPKRKEVLSFVYNTREYLFPGYFEKVKGSVEKYRKHKLQIMKKIYTKFVCSDTFDDFVKCLPSIEEDLNKDLDFFFESDPASESKEEIVISYPGFLAITFYRIAHAIHKIGVKLVPRLISEGAHSLTGIDIHPGATIGSPFFIDHGTGIVIGETSEIGAFVKMYHGVTLGALSLKEGRDLKNKKRHPTIRDYVTIYAGASILGGETEIGERVTIGSNVFIVNSVLKDTTVIYGENHLKTQKTIK